MLTMKAALAALAASLMVQPCRGSDGILLAPLAGKSGPVKILVYVHGALVNEAHYQTLAKSIQAATPLTLWVGLPSFILDTPNPGTINGAVTGMVKRIVAQGGLNTTVADVFVAGHSLGGVFAPAVVNKYGYAGLLEHGSYVTSGLDITSTRFPVLTLGGELDGLTRATRLALCAAPALDPATRGPYRPLPSSHRAHRARIPP